MRFAAIADIHGNCLALEAVLADIAGLGIAEVVNLGDHLSGPLEARRTADMLMDRGFLSIRGNHDRQLLDLDVAAMGPSDRHAHAQLDGRHLAWLASLPATARYGEDVFLCHGTPASDATYWLEKVCGDGAVRMAPIEDIEMQARGIDAALMLCGHSHTPRIVRLRDGRMIVNPGSVGCPAYEDDTPILHKVETGTPHAWYAILERGTAGWSATMRYVAYDHMAMADLARSNGREEWASAIATGCIR